VTAVAPVEERIGRLELIWEERPGVLGWLTTVDHKRIGLLYLFATVAFFLAGGIEALLVRTQLAEPNSGLLSPSTYDQLFTTHGVTMIFLAVIPMQIGAFGNYLVPLLIGARDIAFPRLNALSFWLFLASGCFIYAGVFMGLEPHNHAGGTGGTGSYSLCYACEAERETSDLEDFSENSKEDPVPPVPPCPRDGHADSPRDWCQGCQRERKS
jgi:hypothetical protein